MKTSLRVSGCSSPGKEASSTGSGAPSEAGGPPRQQAASSGPGDAAGGRMTSSHQEDEFVAVRVQDPRVQNEGSWNSYVDYKIFLHTNSKAFTAKTSCVRRRYSEFVWLRKKMQKNAGLVPVPDLPGKSFFSFSNEDFLERRRTGLQAFLEKVVHTTVCLSDSQLHLFLQTQLPIGHILDCVQGHTPYSVTDAILTYASSNRGLAQAQTQTQAQEDDGVKDSSLTVSYESMESPALHAPGPQTNQAFSPQLLSGADLDPLDPLDPLEGLLELRDQQQLQASIRISQQRNHLEAVVEAVVEGGGPPGATFYLGESLDQPAEPVQHSGSRIQTPAVVHPPDGGELGPSPDDEFPGSMEILSLNDGSCEEERPAGNRLGAPEGEGELRDVRLEPLVLERSVNGDSLRDEDPTKDETVQPDLIDGEGTCDEEPPQGLMGGDDEEEEEEEDSRSLPSSNGSIVKVSSEEEEQSGEEEVGLCLQAANGFVTLSPAAVRRWSEEEEEEEESGGGVLDLQVNGRPEGRDEDLGGGSGAGDGDLTENSDISILESSSAPGLAAAAERREDGLGSSG